MRLVQLALAVCAIVFAPLPSLAAPRDAVMNKEGFWGIDVDHGACAASMTLQGGSIFLLRAQDGKVTFGLLGVTRTLPRGKAGRIETEAYGFDFKPSFGDDSMTLFYDGELDARALAALRLARQARILIDGKMVTSMTLEGTGFEGALDGVVACSNGEKGWWGDGVGGASPVSEDDVVFHKDGIWAITSGEGFCLATAAAPDKRYFQLLALPEGIGVAVGASEGKLPRGRKARLQSDSYAFDFKPEYDEDGEYMSSAGPLESADVFALRRAKRVRISVDGRELLDVELSGDTFYEIFDDVAACAAGRKGWWGDGAKPAS